MATKTFTTHVKGAKCDIQNIDKAQTLICKTNSIFIEEVSKMDDDTIETLRTRFKDLKSKRNLAIGKNFFNINQEIKEIEINLMNSIQNITKISL